MPLIKRYPNRKLYDTEAKAYITLEQIAYLIREGQEDHVVDHASREDLTALTLTQVILEQERKRPVEDRTGVAVRDLAPQQLLGLPQPAVRGLADRELDPIAARGQGRDDGMPAR